MNFYSFHIGDYASSTRHLSWLEDAAYRRLLDVYYVTEAPITTDMRQVYRLLIASTQEQREAVDVVLSEFFVLTDYGYVHDRCETEISCASDKRAKASQSAKARWGNAKDQEVALPTDSDRIANAPEETCERINKPCVINAPNPNPNPIPNKEAKASKETFVAPDWVPAEQWAEFVKMRRAMRNVPFTGAAAKGVVAELLKLANAGHDAASLLTLAVTNGWRTVYPPKTNRSHGQGETTYQRSMRERVEEFSPSIARQAPDFSKTFIEEVRDVTVIASH